MHRPLLTACLLIACTLPATHAATQGHYDRKAEEARQLQQRNVTIFIDVDFGARKTGAADELNQSHQAFNRQGFRVVDVVGYTENGDLQGFFVTYARD
ncbi:hypothetical protein H4F99_02985 [Lysobacter sp. SG-8]|uniref:Uncharacterized protein n=1 Tax=Marilutibacter penaei TaxID=2759900 RepID=A0A7W3YDN9_9GAMM|nr:hypothetical protein [Lysobacter penaei]MBB1087450.1 hypothetical protein [Lysobacter penaei]